MHHDGESIESNRELDEIDSIAGAGFEFFAVDRPRGIGDFKLTGAEAPEAIACPCLLEIDLGVIS